MVKNYCYQKVQTKN